MAVILLVTLAIYIASVHSFVNLNPPWYLGAHETNPIRWPYGGCVEVSKIYPAPGSHLPPSLNKYAKEWSLTITVVFSRPVTRILWKFTNRTRLRLTPQGKKDSSGQRSSLVAINYHSLADLYACADIQLNRTCTRNACLFLKLGKMYVMYMPTTSGPTRRGNVFSDEFEFIFKVPAYAKDHVSEFYFALDGGWMYSPVYKFMSYPHVEYVPYVTVRYLPPNNDSASSRPLERDTNYWVNYPSTCAAHGGLIYRPFIFSRTKKQQAPIVGSPKFLAELSEVVNVSSKENRKLRLYYQMKQHGIHTVPFPDSIKVLDKETNLKITLSAPSIKALIFEYKTPNLFIPVTTKYVFDYRERAYYEGPKWNAYFFINKQKFPEVCRDPNRKFDCNSFVYSRAFPNLSQHTHHFFTKSRYDGYRTAAEARQTVNTNGLNIKHYHSLNVSDDEQFPFSSTSAVWQRSRLVSSHAHCLQHHRHGDYCQRTVDNLVLDPYWKFFVILVKHINEILDNFMICNELKVMLYKSERNLYGDGHVGMMRYSATGSAYEKDMSDVIPLVNFKVSFHYLDPYRRKLLTDMCHFDVKRNVGKWGRLRTFIERGNMYRMHYSKSSTTWIIQQTMYVGYYNKNDQQRYYLKATIVSYPEHIKKAVERYAVLTNVQPAQFTGEHKDTRLRAARESYPLEKAVFIPRKLAHIRGCGTLRIFNDDISGIQAEYHRRYGKNYHEQLCDKPPDDCTGLPFDSLDRFPLIPPFNVLGLNGPNNPRWEFRRRAMYYRDNTVNDLFIINSPNSHYIGVVEISGVEVKDPVFVEKSCNDFWKFSPDRYEITRGHLMGTITNEGEGGSDVVVSVQCTPKLGVLPKNATVWVGPHQTETIKFKLGGYLMDTTEEETAGYKCEMSIAVDVTLFTSVVGKNLPICKIFIPTFGGSFVDPCETYLDHDIMYYNLPKEFAHDFSLNAFLSSAVGREYELLKLISIKLVKYHMIRLSCENDDVLALTEDQLFISSLSNNLVGQDIDLIHSIDKLLQHRIYIFIKRRQSSKDDIETKCLITLIASPYATCAISSRKYIVLTKADVPVAMALEETEAARKTVKIVQTIWNKWISEREEVIAAVLACTIVSLVLIVLVVTGNSGLFIYSKLSTSERKIVQIREELLSRKREHKKTWNNPQMYLVKGILGPHYILYNFKATDALDTGNLKVLKIAGTLKYKEKTLQVIFGHVKKVIVRKTRKGKAPDQVWIQASSGMYLLKQKYVSKEYEEDFDSLLQRHANKDTTTL